MKRIAIYIGLAALSAGLAIGQTTQDTPSPHDPAMMVQMRISMLTTLLSLTDAQKTQATTIFTNAQTAAQTVRTNLETAEQSLSSAIKTNSTTSIDSLAQTIGNLEGQLAAINAKADAAFYAILTADQKVKYDSLPHGFGGGPGGGRGGPGHLGSSGPGR